MFALCFVPEPELLLTGERQKEQGETDSKEINSSVQ